MQEQNVPIIDIRRPDEWRSTGVISGSYLLTFFDAKGNYNLNQWLAELNDIAGEFAFVRIQYDSYFGGGFYGGPWLTDFPASDEKIGSWHPSNIV